MIGKQDRALRDYRTVTALVLHTQKVEGITIEAEASEVNDKLIFPEDPDELVEYICR